MEVQGCWVGMVMVIQWLFEQSAYGWELSWDDQRQLHQVPKTWFCRPAWDNQNHPAHLTLKFLCNLGQQGGGREGVRNQVSHGMLRVSTAQA